MSKYPPPNPSSPPAIFILIELFLLMVTKDISNLLEPKSIIRKHSELSNLFFDM